MAFVSEFLCTQFPFCFESTLSAVYSDNTNDFQESKCLLLPMISAANHQFLTVKFTISLTRPETN